jgi:tRNA(Arg) A34 adenosine deaminase TadA
VVRLLPEGRQLQGCSATHTKQRHAKTPHPTADTTRLGFSQPCVRCLRALAAFGVHRVIFSTGGERSDGEVACEVHEVRQLLADAAECGHCSRGDRRAVESGAVRRGVCQW